MKDANMPAIPCEFDHNKDANGVEQYTGLTKREHFAAMAMQGILVNADLRDLDIVAKRAVRMANELLSELELKKC